MKWMMASVTLMKQHLVLGLNTMHVFVYIAYLYTVSKNTALLPNDILYAENNIQIENSCFFRQKLDK